MCVHCGQYLILSCLYILQSLGTFAIVKYKHVCLMSSARMGRNIRVKKSQIKKFCVKIKLYSFAAHFQAVV
jgi:hypothetical protein